MVITHRIFSVILFALAGGVLLTSLPSAPALDALEERGGTRAMPAQELTPAIPAFVVNPGVEVNPFSDEMLGVGLVNWEHSWGKPFPSEVPGLVQAMREQGVKLIRYAGGLWSNDVGFDRTPQRRPFEAWTQNGDTYYFHYGTDELESVHALAQALGAEVIIQVNISTADPAMWAEIGRAHV